MENTILETPTQYTERLVKENIQKLKTTAVDFALKLNSGYRTTDTNKLIESAELIYKFISK